MARDLPGQTVMFPDLEFSRDRSEEAGTAPAVAVHAARMADAAPALGLPRKATCTANEAHLCTGISARQINYYVTDGTLLAINSARVPVGKRVNKRRGGKLDRWRIVVRRTPEFMADNYCAFLTLEEFIRSRLNTQE